LEKTALIWILSLLAGSDARAKAFDRAAYAMRAHADDPVGYLRLRLARPGRSWRQRTTLRIAIAEVVARLGRGRAQ
jgi:hypothetical protein